MTTLAEQLNQTFQGFFVDTGAIPETPNHDEFLNEPLPEPTPTPIPDRPTEWEARTGKDGSE